MQFSLSEDDQMIVGSVAELCAQSIGTNATAWDDAGDLPATVVTAVAELGLFGMSVPEVHGGVGLSMVTKTAVLEALGAGDASLAAVVAAHDGLAAAHVASSATEAQRGAWLPSWAAGETLATWGSANGTLTATQTGEGLRLSGTVAIWAGLSLATRYVLCVEVDGTAKALLIKADQAGVSHQRVNRLGMRSAGAGTLRLTDVLVPAEAVIGDADSAQHDAIVATRAAEHRLALAAIACGVGRAALTAATAYAKERQQFGQPIANFQAIQWKLADAATELDAAALLVGRAAWLSDDGQSITAAAAHAKIMATTAAERASSEALQIHGGYGYTREFPVERHLRAAKVLAVSAGTNRASRAATARALQQRVGS